MNAKIVMCFGTFDLLHPGHLYYLSEAKRFAGLLYVIVATDKNSKKSKGHAPLNDEKTRLKMIRSLEIVDRAFLGDEKNKLKLMLKFKPNFVCLGHDHATEEKVLEKLLQKKGLKTKVRKIRALHPHKFKGKKIRERIKSGE